MQWLYYGLGSLFALAWLVAAWWALFQDRARGRLRCPTCFYTLTDPLPDLCPECGHAWGSRSRLTRTRRSRKRLLLANLLLIPAITTGGLGYAQNHNAWNLVPDAVLTRLLFLNSDSYVYQIRLRRYEGKLNTSETLRVVRQGRKLIGSPSDANRERGLVLLETIAKNSYVDLDTAEPGTTYPQLEELEPERTTAALLDLYHAASTDPATLVRIHNLLVHLRDVDHRAMVRLLRDLAHPDPDVRLAVYETFDTQWHPSRTVKRWPSAQHMMPSTHSIRAIADSTPPLKLHLAQVQTQLAAVDEMLKGLEPTFQGDTFTDETIEILRELAKGPPADPDPPNSRSRRNSPEVLIKSLSLWLWCRFEGFTPECWAEVERVANRGNQLIRPVAVSLTAGFDYSPKLEDVLRAALLDFTGEWFTNYRAAESAASFGTQAKGLIPDFLKYAADIHRPGSSSGFSNDFLAIGGDMPDLLAATLDRVFNYLDAESAGEITDLAHYLDGGHKLSPDLEALGDLETRNPDAAARILPLLEDPRQGIAVPAAYAHAQLSGNPTPATRVVLSYEPDLALDLFGNSPQYYVYGLILADLLDVSQLENYTLDPAHPERPAAFAGFASTYLNPCPPNLAPLLQEIAQGNDHAAADAANIALGTIEQD